MTESCVSKLLHGKAIVKCDYISGIVVDFGNSCILGCDEDSFFLRDSEILSCDDVIGLRFVDFIENEEFEIFVFENDVMLKIPLINVEHWVYQNSEGVIMVSN